jgi:hypothetical protein
VCAAVSRVIEQDLVEFRAFHLKGGRGFRAKAVLEVEADLTASAAGGDFGTVLADEPCGVQFRQQTEALEGLHTEREQGFSDVEAGELLPFKDGHLAAEACE